MQKREGGTLYTSSATESYLVPVAAVKLEDNAAARACVLTLPISSSSSPAAYILAPDIASPGRARGNIIFLNSILITDRVESRAS